MYAATGMGAGHETGQIYRMEISNLGLGKGAMAVDLSACRPRLWHQRNTFRVKVVQSALFATPLGHRNYENFGVAQKGAGRS